MDWVLKIIALKNNKDLSYYLIVPIPKKKSDVNRLKIQLQQIFLEFISKIIAHRFINE